MGKRTLIIAYIVFAIGAVLILASPWLVRNYFGILKFSESGPLGDTIGGISAPLTGLVGSFLVFQALLAQIKANKIITDQFKEQKALSIVTEQLKMIRDDIKEYKFEDSQLFPYIDDTKYFGVEGIKVALHKYPIKHKETPADMIVLDSRINDIRYLLNSILFLIDLTKTSYLNTLDELRLLDMINQVYYTRLYNVLLEHNFKREGLQQPCEVCGSKHGIPENLYKINDLIVRKLRLDWPTPQINKG